MQKGKKTPAKWYSLYQFQIFWVLQSVLLFKGSYWPICLFFFLDSKYSLKKQSHAVLFSLIFLVGVQLEVLVLIYKALQGWCQVICHILALESVQPIWCTWEKLLMVPHLGGKTQEMLFFQRQCCSFGVAEVNFQADSHWDYFLKQSKWSSSWRHFASLILGL